MTFPEPEACRRSKKRCSRSRELCRRNLSKRRKCPVEKKQAEAKRRREEEPIEEEEEEHAKDGVSLDELFTMKPEIFQTAGPMKRKQRDKKKGKKGKKKSVELEFDEGRGEVVGRKMHKRGDATPENDWE